MALSETWLSDHGDAEILIEGYQVFRSDRERTKSRYGRDSGGVAVYVRDDAAIETEVILKYSNKLMEIIGIYMKGLNIVIYVVYRTPDDPTHNRHSGHNEFSQGLNVIRESLDNLPTPTPDLIVCGDFNLPNADWTKGGCKKGSNRVRDEEKMVKTLDELMSDNFLTQVIHGPTHRDGNILDLLFTNNSQLVHSSLSTYSSVSDHNVVEVKTHIKQHREAEENTKEDKPLREPSFFDLNFFSDEINWSQFNEELLSYNWIQEFKGSNANDMLKRFVSVCLSIATDLVPEKKQPSRSRCRIPRHRRILMRTRRRINTQLTKSPCEARRIALTNRLIKIEKQLCQSHCDEEELREASAVQRIKTNSKYFFSYAKSFSRIKTGIGPLEDDSNCLTSNPKTMAEILSDQYASVFSQPKHSSNEPQDLFPDHPESQTSISDILFTEEELIEAMKEVKSNSASGPDEFPAMILK